jgi:hypothetical protein
MPTDLKRRVEPDRIDKRQRDLMICWFIRHPDALSELEQSVRPTKEESCVVTESFEIGEGSDFQNLFLD